MWRRDGLETLAPTEGLCEQFTVDELRNAIHWRSKATEPSEVASDMLKCSNEARVRWVIDRCYAIVREGVIPKDWRKSWMLSINKGKGDIWMVVHIEALN